MGAIPARYGSTRLPGKPLLPIAGRPMIEHVYTRVAQARGLDRVVVLTDDERIARAVEAFGGEWEMTPADCASGTDRIAWAARRWGAAATSAIINIQGDEPLIDPEEISRIAEHLAANPGRSGGDPGDPGGAGGDGEPERGQGGAGPRRLGALLQPLGRSPIPGSEGGAAPLKHLGIYGYQRDALLRLAALPPTPLERSESLEQLRALENGIRHPGADRRPGVDRSRYGGGSGARGKNPDAERI